VSFRLALVAPACLPVAAAIRSLSVSSPPGDKNPQYNGREAGWVGVGGRSGRGRGTKTSWHHGRAFLPPPSLHPPTQSSSPVTSPPNRSRLWSPTQTARARQMRCGVGCASGLAQPVPAQCRGFLPTVLQRPTLGHGLVLCRHPVKPRPSVCGACQQLCLRPATRRLRPSGCPLPSSNASSPA
jgi:hypothetical protein